MSDDLRFDGVGAMVHVFAMASAFVRESVADVPEARMCAFAGTIVNHPAWTLAHLNAYAASVLAMLDEFDASAADAELARFGYGTMPLSDASAYASKSELLRQFDERCARIIAMVPMKHAAYFSRPAPAKYQPHARMIGDVATILMTTHMGYHLGQLRQWRRAAGLPTG